MSKIRYELDPHNKLIKIGPGRFRQVVDGVFKLDRRNNLSYHVKKSDNVDTPQQIKFSGKWALGEKNGLVFSFDKWNNQINGNKLILQGELLCADGSELVYSVASRDKIYLLKFSGSWQADKYNRLTFVAQREKGPADKLVLQGRWEINKNNEIIYTAARKNTITLKGRWDIAAKNRLSYTINKDIGSGFDFTASFQRAVKNGLVFALGVGYGARKRTVALSGDWKLDKSSHLSFEVKYADKAIKVESGLSKLFLKGAGEAFVKTLVSPKEWTIICGAGIRW